MSGFEMVSFNDIENKGIKLITRIRKILFVTMKYDGNMYLWDELLDCEKKSIRNELYNIRRETDKCIEDYKVQFSLLPSSSTILYNFYIEINNKIQLEKDLEDRYPVLTEIYNLMYYSDEENKKMTSDEISEYSELIKRFDEIMSKAVTIKDKANTLISKINECWYDHKLVLKEKEKAKLACNLIIEESEETIDFFKHGIYINDEEIRKFSVLINGYLGQLDEIEKTFYQFISHYEACEKIYRPNKKPKITKATKDICTEIFDRLKDYNFDARCIAEQFEAIPHNKLTDSHKKAIIMCLYQMMRDYSGYDIEDIKKKSNDNVSEYMSNKIHEMLNNECEETENISNKNVSRCILYADMINCILTIESVFKNTTSKAGIINAFNKLNMLDDPQNIDSNKKTG